MSKKLTKREGETKLERTVRLWLNEHGKSYDNGWKGALRDVEHSGCSSGIVNELIYYTDTVKFFKRHQKEINKLFAEMIYSTDATGPMGLFGERWDESDPLAFDVQNQNLLAWFAFEETAHRFGGADEKD